MSLRVNAERWCEAVLPFSHSARPALCNDAASAFCSECGRAICQEHETYCPECEASYCANCEHECVPVPLADQRQLAPEREQTAARLLRWMVSLTRSAASRRTCPYCKNVMSATGMASWLCRECMHSESERHISFLEVSSAEPAKQCGCARCCAALSRKAAA